MRSVASSSSQYSSRSFDETSALLPIETKLERPSPRAVRLLEQRQAERAALRRERDRGPAGAARRANVAFSRDRARRDAEAVRADQARAVRAHEREQLVLTRLALARRSPRSPPR